MVKYFIYHFKVLNTEVILITLFLYFLDLKIVYFQISINVIKSYIKTFPSARQLPTEVGPTPHIHRFIPNLYTNLT